jgi:hypothetical protein
MTKKINVDKICVMHIHRKTPHRYIKWRPPFEIFGITLSPGGFYYTYIGSEYRSVNDITSDGKLYIEDKTVYYRPHVELEMVNDRKTQIWFDDEAELDVFINSEVMKKVKFIDV